jgi:hypothetical protein
MEIIGLDSTPSIGTAEKQSNPAPPSVVAGGYVFETDMGGLPGQFWMLGQMSIGNASVFTGGQAVQDGGVNVVFTNPATTFTVGAKGRGMFQQTTNLGTLNCTVYMVSSSKMYILQTNDNHSGSGIAELQVPGQDGFGTLNNTFIASGAEIGDGNVTFVAEFVADGLGHVSGIEDISQPQAGNPSQLSVSTVVLSATNSVPNKLGAMVFAVSSAGTGILNLDALLVSSDSAYFIGQPNDVDGTFVVQP